MVDTNNSEGNKYNFTKDENINNYQVNSYNLSFEKTISDNSNSNNFLITLQTC